MWAKRGVLSRWTTALTLGALLVALGGSTMPAIITPGAVTFMHGEGIACAGCHAAFQRPLAEWPLAAFAESRPAADSGRCLACHRLGDNGIETHSLPHDRLAELTAEAWRPSEKERAPAFAVLSGMVFGKPQHSGAAVPCATCHREHRGQEFDLTAMSERRCMSCHVAAFASFSRGHPEFDDYPFRRRTRIEFDHESHFGKHFRKAPESERAPGECRDCHTPDVDGRTMGVFGFEAACAGCHASQIEGAGRASAKGIPVITVPGLDIAALAENALAVGHWPAYADENATPFMDFLLAGDAPYAAARRALAGTDLMDLEDMGADERAAVETLAWSVKELISEIAAAGMPALKQRIESALGGDVAGERFTRLAALVPADTVRAFRDEGFPGLADEIARRRRGESVPIPGQAAGAATKAPAPESAASDEDDSILDDEDELLDDEDELLDDEDELLDDEDELLDDEDELLDDEDDSILDDDEDSILDAGDALGDEDETAGEDAEVAPAALSAEGEAWAEAGGWYREDFTLRYRPSGHADGFVRAWLDLSGSVADAPGAEAAGSIFEGLAAPESPVSCVKCHSVDANADGTRTVNWHARRPEPDFKPFTAFSHTAHFSLLDESGCVSCHALDPGADTASGYADRDAATFVRGFKPVERRICVQCHTGEAAGEGCLTCHNYHVGTFPPAMIATPATMEKSPN